MSENTGFAGLLSTLIKGARESDSEVTSQSSVAPKPPVPVLISPRKAIGGVASGFDLQGVRCRKERELREKIRKAESFSMRLNSYCEAGQEDIQQERLRLLTHAYQVDGKVTPVLKEACNNVLQALRIPQGLDVFVISDSSPNAFSFPSRKGTRFIMGLNSSLIELFTTEELMFVIGHELGHSILRHDLTPQVPMSHPNFSFLEKMTLRALSRAQEISADRFGYLVCPNSKIAGSALFKLHSGLGEKWIRFDEKAYAGQFDKLSQMAEIVEMEGNNLSHPLTPLRAKAVMDFAESSLFFEASGQLKSGISSDELEMKIENNLSVLETDWRKLESADFNGATMDFFVNAALYLVAADKSLDPFEENWLQVTFKDDAGEFIKHMASPDFPAATEEILRRTGQILIGHLTEIQRVKMFEDIVVPAFGNGGIQDEEWVVINKIVECLDIRVEFAKKALDIAAGKAEAMLPPQDAGQVSPKKRGRKPKAKTE